MTITRDEQYGWNVTLTGLPAVWCGTLEIALRLVHSVDTQRYLVSL